VEARLVGWEVQVGRRANVVVHSFQGGGHTYVWRFSRVAPVEQTRPVELVIDGLLWDEIVQLRQDGQVAWRRI